VYHGDVLFVDGVHSPSAQLPLSLTRYSPDAALGLFNDKVFINYLSTSFSALGAIHL